MVALFRTGGPTGVWMAARRKKKEQEDTGGILTAEERILKEVHDAYVVRDSVAEDTGLLGEIGSKMGEQCSPSAEP